MTDRFEGCRLKIARARKHIADVEDLWESTLDRDGDRPFGITFIPSRRGAAVIVDASFHADRAPPADLGLMAADALHNLRSALDHFVARLKEAHGASSRKGGMVIAGTEAEWVERNWALRGIPAESPAWEAIWDAQPLHADSPADHPLAVLASLNNADKHRLLYLAFAYPEAHDGLELVEVLSDRGVTSATSKWVAGQPLENGTPVARFTCAPGTRIEDTLRANRQMRLTASIGEVGEGRASIHAMADAVDALVARGPGLID